MVWLAIGIVIGFLVGISVGAILASLEIPYDEETCGF
jgi:uncharacterized membrane-anchored protein YhcB (DUF1043 family)